MGDHSTCPMCKADLNEQLVCPRCGYTATRSPTLPSGECDPDVRRWPMLVARAVSTLLVFLLLVAVLIYFLVPCAGTFSHYFSKRS